MFLLAKLISHTLLGFLLGSLGSVITLSLGVRLTFQVFTALFMFATAMNLLDVHPIFRYLAFQPPRFIRKMVKNTSQSKALFAPFILGLMTIFIPCGVTQAMEVLAINTGNPIAGALIMLAFVLGTSPLFALLGIATAKLSETWNRQFSKVAAYALIGMMIYSLNGVLVVLNSPLTIQSMTRPIVYFFSNERFANKTQANFAPVENGVQKVGIEVFNQGYVPNYIRVKKGLPVELTVSSNDVYSCASAFIFKEFGIRAYLAPTDTKTFTFTPTIDGRFAFTCSMGMYSGVMEVI
jgi:sulfite exporter TauE/SafE